MNSGRVRAAVMAALLVACGGESDAPRAGVGRDTAADAVTRRADPTGERWSIEVAGTGGAIGPTTAHADLAGAFDSRLIDTMIHMGEAQFVPGTVVFPDDPLRRIELVWLDSARARPWRVQLTGDSTVWSVGPGITLGTSLSDLARLNQAPLSLTGFGWDYGGTVMGWNQGALEQALLGGNGRVILRLAVDSASVGSDDALAVSGDGIFPSDNRAMQRLDPKVRQIIVEYDSDAAGR